MGRGSFLYALWCLGLSGLFLGVPDAITLTGVTAPCS